MTQSLAQLQAERRAAADGMVDGSVLQKTYRAFAAQLQPHVEREAAAQDKSLADERRIQELEAALRRTLDWLASYPGEGTMRKGGPYEQARAALGDVTATKGEAK